jgi:hypothetical protein
MIDDDDKCEAVGGMRIGRETEVLEENLRQCHCVHRKSYMTCPGLEPGGLIMLTDGQTLCHNHSPRPVAAALFGPFKREILLNNIRKLSCYT